MLGILYAHHIAIEIMGTEYEPQGVIQHVVLFSALTLLFGLAGIGSVTVLRRIRGQSYSNSRPT